MKLCITYQIWPIHTNKSHTFQQICPFALIIFSLIQPLRVENSLFCTFLSSPFSILLRYT